MTDFQDELTEEDKRLLAEVDKDGQPKEHLKTKIKKIFKVILHEFHILIQKNFFRKSLE